MVVVLGGGEWGAFIVGQLRRAHAAGRLRPERVVVVDRDPACAARAFPREEPPLEVETAEWADWLDRRLLELPPEAQLVPYHFAPHLFFDWLARAAERAGLRAVKGLPPEAPAGVPYSRATAGGDRALSYATWTCPLTCIEPALCPHTRGPKDWSLYGDLARASGTESLVFSCLHLAYGVGTVPVAALFDARARMIAAARRRPARFLVATSSHCHALAATLEVAPS
jgi:hypothetical protein